MDTRKTHQTYYFSKFLVVGIINSLVGYSIIFSSMSLLKLSPEISNVCGYGVGLILSYFLNRNFTFKSNLEKYKEFFRFLTVFCLAYAANFIMLLVLIYDYRINHALSQLLAGGVYISSAFFMNKHYVFKKLR